MGRAVKVTSLLICSDLGVLPVDFVLTPFLRRPLLLALLDLQPAIMILLVAPFGGPVPFPLVVFVAGNRSSL